MRASGKRDLVAGLYVQCLRRAHLHTPTRRSRVLTRSPGSGYPTFDASAPDQEENSQRGLQDENFSPLDSLSINPGLQSVRRQGPEARGRSLRKLAYIFFFLCRTLGNKSSKVEVICKGDKVPELFARHGRVVWLAWERDDVYS